MELQSSSTIPSVSATLRSSDRSVQYDSGYVSGSDGRKIEITKTIGSHAAHQCAVIEIRTLAHDIVTVNGADISFKKGNLRTRLALSKVSHFAPIDESSARIHLMRLMGGHTLG